MLTRMTSSQYHNLQLGGHKQKKLQRTCYELTHKRLERINIVQSSWINSFKNKLDLFNR